MNIIPLLVLVVFQAAGQTEPEKRPIPDAAAQKDAEKLIRDVFKDEYAKRGPADRVTLAGKLLDQARQTKDDPASQYVLFREAQELYVQGGDLAGALKAIDELSRAYAADVSALRASALTSFAKNARTPDDLKTLATAQLRLVDEALAADQYEIAEKAAAAALAAARRAAIVPMTAKAVAKSKEVADQKSKFEKLKRARETLAAKPDDPAANLAVGQYTCFVKGDWPAGLRLLSLASDATLKSLADQDLAAPSTPVDQAALGDGWWDLSEKESAAAKEVVRRHAVLWYEKATPKLTGLNRTKIEKRIQEFRTTLLAKGNWQEVEPKIFGKPGGPGEPLTVVAKQGFYTWEVATSFPKGDFDGVSIRVRMDPAEGAMALVIFEVRDKGVFVDAKREIFVATHHEANSWKHDFTSPWPRKDEAVLTVLLVDGEYVYYLDSREMTRAKTMTAAITGLRLEAWDGTVKFDRMRLRRVE